MKYNRFVISGKLFWFLTLLITLPCLARALNGKIVDQEGRPLGGVVIYDLSRQAVSIYNFESLQDRLKDQVVVVGVSIDQERQTLRAASLGCP